MLQKFLIDTLSSLQFLSRLPLASPTGDALPDFKRSAYTFPVAGFIIAMPSSFVLVMGQATGLPVSVLAVLAVALMMILTGALHEDGLADTADGFWGGHTKQRKLDIMRDSSIGTYGVLALIVSFVLRVSMIMWLFQGLGALATGTIMIAAASLSRGAMLMPWYRLPAARQSNPQDDEPGEEGSKPASGLSVRYGSPDARTITTALIATLPALFLLIESVGWLNTGIALVVFGGCIVMVMRTSMRHVGGHTGDTLGATQQISELGLLLGLVWTM